MTEEKEPVVKVTHGSGNDGSKIDETTALREPGQAIVEENRPPLQQQKKKEEGGQG